MANVIALAAIILMLVAAYYLWRFMLRRGMRAVVRAFREHGAVSPKKAATLEEMGLQPLTILNRMFRPRDYKRPASQILAREGIIKMTEGPRFYLDETALKQSRIAGFVGDE